MTSFYLFSNIPTKVTRYLIIFTFLSIYQNETLEDTAIKLAAIPDNIPSAYVLTN